MKKLSKKKRLYGFIATFCFVLAWFVMFTHKVAGEGHISSDSVVYVPDTASNIQDSIKITKNQVEKTQSVTGGRKFDDIIKRKSLEYAVSFELMSDIIDCENKPRDPELQSYHRYTEGQVARNPKWNVEVNQREQSFGLSQIHLPAHPTITRDQAVDPEFAIDFMAKNIAKGNASWWSCYKKVVRR